MLSNLLERPLLFLLVALLALFVLTPFFEATVLTDVVVSVVLCFGVYAVSANRRVLLVCAVLAVLGISTIWTGHWMRTRWLQITVSGVSLTFFVIVAVQILQQVFHREKADTETIVGAICIYLLLGVLWADVYAILEAVKPGSFSQEIVESGENILVRNQRNEFTYYSFVTLSTLGYGEIVPVTRQARALAALEAVTGQLYLAVIIARLVALYHTATTKDSPR